MTARPFRPTDARSCSSAIPDLRNEPQGSPSPAVKSDDFVDATPVFSPDGRRIAFNRYQRPSPGFVSVGIFTMLVNGTHERRLTSVTAGGLDWQRRPR